MTRCMAFLTDEKGRSPVLIPVELMVFLCWVCMFYLFPGENTKPLLCFVSVYMGTVIVMPENGTIQRPAPECKDLKMTQSYPSMESQSPCWLQKNDSGSQCICILVITLQTTGLAWVFDVSSSRVCTEIVFKMLPCAHGTMWKQKTMCM